MGKHDNNWTDKEKNQEKATSYYCFYTMEQVLKKLLQGMTCILAWLTISPLFYYLTYKWKLIGKKLRVFLLLISPMFLILYAILCVYGLYFYYAYQRKYKFADKETLERITGVTYPDFKIIEYEKGKTGFLMDYRDKLIIEFEDTPSSKFYQTLDSLIVTQQTDWSKQDNTYSYSKIWGNGYPAPIGENEEDDMIFCISFSKGSRQATIDYGAW